MDYYSERVLWLLAATVSLPLFLLLGYIGWATVLVWSVLVTPLVISRARREEGGATLTRGLKLAWGLAVVSSGINGVMLLPPSDTVLPEALAVSLSVLFIANAWGGLALSVIVIAGVTHAHVRDERRPV